MSLSKVAPLCVFCKSGRGIYTCPKCNKKYCSSYCYKCREHADCSEAFYKDWVEQSLQEQSCDPTDKEEMLRMLKKFEDESAADSDDNEPCLKERFADLNIHEADEDEIWQHLSEEEKNNFKTLLQNEEKIEAIVTVKQPWWTQTVLNLVMEDDTEDPDAKDSVAVRPPFPLNAKKLSELTSAVPSSCIQNNLVNILYSYSFLCRFYNSDLRDFLEEAVDFLFTFSPVLSSGCNYSSLEEALLDSVCVISDSDLKMPMQSIKSIVNDVAAILNGPSNGKTSTFVLCALHDIKLLLLEMRNEYKEKKDVVKDLKKRLLLAVKKIEYFISWSLEFESTLKNIASDMVLLMLPDLIPEPNVLDENKEACIDTKDKTLIEEIN